MKLFQKIRELVQDQSMLVCVLIGIICVERVIHLHQTKSNHSHHLELLHFLDQNLQMLLGL
jgi:hypothetical protein